MEVNSASFVKDSSRILKHERIVEGQHPLYLFSNDGIVYKEAPSFTMVLYPYLPNGDLLDAVIEKGTFPERVVQTLAKGMISCLRELHEQCSHAHMDVKPENFLLDEHYQPTLTDLEFCCDIYQE